MASNLNRAGALALSALVLQGAALAQEPFQGSTSVVTVEVPVQVIKDGAPVRGLTADHFDVYDGRERQVLSGFEVVDLAAPAAAGPGDAVPVAARRHFLLLFDLSFSDPTAIVKARGAAYDLVKAGLKPSDLVAVGSYTVARGPSLVLGFTPDRSQIAAALDTLGIPELAPKGIDPAGLIFGDLQPDADNVMSQASGGRFEGAIAQHLQDVARMGARADRESRRNQVLAFARSFSDLGRLMGSLEGRKHVVLFSGGFDSSLLFATTDEATTKEMNRAVESGEYWKVDSDQRFGSSRAQNVLGEMIEEFRRADCVIQAVDVGGLRGAADATAAAGGTGGRGGEGGGVGQDGLFAMAEGTGGELYRNWNDLRGAMSQMLDRTSVTYVLSFEPDDLKADGKYRKLRVELKDAPRGARVVHRPGYYAPKAARELSPLERRLTTAQRILNAEEGGSIRTSVLASPFPTGRAEAYVPVVVEIDGATLLEGTTGEALTAEIYAYGIDAAGNIRDFFSQSLGFDLAKTRQGLAQKGLKFWGHFDLPPAAYTLRVMVVNGQSGRSSLTVVPLTVPDFAAGAPVLLPAFFPEPPGGWLLAREDAGAQAGPQAEYPFVIADESYIPAAKPALAAGQPVRVALVGYNLGGGDLAFEGRVLDREGREVPGATLNVLDRPKTGTQGVSRVRASLEPKGLAPGEYTLVVGVIDPATGTRESSSAPFVVVDGRASGR